MTRPRPRGLALFLAISLIPIFLLLLYTVVGTAQGSTRAARQRLEQDRLFYLCEAGLQVATQAYADSGCLAVTHLSDGSAPPAGQALEASFPGLALDRDGWWAWSWSPGQDPAESFTRSGQPESFRFQVVQPALGRWLMRCEGRVGPTRLTQELTGPSESVAAFSEFSDGDLSLGVTGTFGSLQTHRIHANGNLYLYQFTPAAGMPGPRWKVDERVTVRGDLQVRWGSGTRNVGLEVGGLQGPLLDNRSPRDSSYSDWVNHARSTWGELVQDGRCGAPYRQAPRARLIQQDGPVARAATLRIQAATSAPWCQDRTFHNRGEGREVTVKQVDLAALSASGAFPSNGVLYSEVPLLLRNGARLSGPLSIVCAGSIYVQGDFNKRFPTQADLTGGTSQKKPASLIARDRLWVLSSGFTDAGSYAGAPPPAVEPPAYPGDPTELELNAALVTGLGGRFGTDRTLTPSVGGQPNPYYSSSFPYFPGNCPGLALEDFNAFGLEVPLRSSGCHCQLRLNRMAALDNSDAGPDREAWLVVPGGGGSPPLGAVTFDPDLEAAPPPFLPGVLGQGVLRTAAP